MSAPAEKLPPAPVTMPIERSWSASSSSIAAFMSLRRLIVTRVLDLGPFTVTTSIGPGRSVSSSSSWWRAHDTVL
jgi:hypothetical protein